MFFINKVLWKMFKIKIILFGIATTDKEWRNYTCLSCWSKYELGVESQHW
jgi:hypothetical protein